MKKLVTTLGLFSLLLIVTSFTTPNETGGVNNGGKSSNGGLNIEAGGTNNGGKSSNGGLNIEAGGTNNGGKSSNGGLN